MVLFVEFLIDYLYYKDYNKIDFLKMKITKEGLNMLELKNVSKYYSNNGVVTLGLRNINLSFQAGEIVAITGDSGSGKSTLLNVITGVDTYEEGEIYFYGNETSYFNQNDLDQFRKDNVSFIFQNYNIIDSYTVLENVMLPLLLAGKVHEEAKKIALSIIERVGLKNRVSHRGTKLSGGEKQRCVIARALASESKILACDEPTGNLDSKTGAEIIQLIQEVAKDKLVLIVTHNYAQVQDIVTRKIRISDGEVVEDIHIVEQPYEEEANHEVENKKLKKSVYFKIALQNIISTPKKLIFTTLVFMVISFITLILSLMMVQESKESNQYENDKYSLQSKERLIVYDKNHHYLDTEKLEKVKYNALKYNAFYEETEFRGYVLGEEDKDRHDISSWIKYTDQKIKYKIIFGEDCKSETDIVLVCDESYADEWFLGDINSYIGYQFYYEDNYNEESLGTFVGVAISKEVSGMGFYIQSKQQMPQHFMQFLNFQNTRWNYMVDNEIFGIWRENTNLDKTYISCPTKLKDKIKFSLVYGEIYNAECLVNGKPIEIVYEDKEEQLGRVILYCGKDYAQQRSIEFGGVYEATIYASSKSLNTLKAQLEEMGFNVTIPSKIKMTNFIDTAVLIVFASMIVIAMICLYFISYVILSRVYASKNKDYGVLRTLGMVQKQLGRIVILEVITIGIISSILSLVIFILLYNTTRFFQMGDYMGVSILLFYFGLMLIFSYFIARRFNRRLYKFSVNTTLKGEVARND